MNPAPQSKIKPGIVCAETIPAELSFPVVIVGGGACGLVAALMLRDAGIECLVIERDAVPSGSSALSSGFIPAAGTAVQKAEGIDDSVELFAADIMAKTQGTAAAHLVRAYAAAVGPALDQLQATHGITFEVLSGFMYPGHSVLRMHSVPERTGTALMMQLEKAALACGVTLLTESWVRELWLDPQGDVLGVGYQQPDGSLTHVACSHVLLACNGFGGNAEMVSHLIPEMQDAIFAGHAGNDGAAIAWGRALGARLADLGGYQGHGSWAIPQGALVSWAVMMDGGVQINALGERFHDETHGYSEASVKVLAQPGAVAWNVFDQQTLKLARSFPDFRDAESAGALKACACESALAGLIGCDESAVIKTLAALGSDVADPFGRLVIRQLQAPYFAIKVTGALFHTQGGLDIDAQCRVRRADGTPFSTLLAAGGAARGVSGNAVWGYLSGNGLLSAVAGGAIAAHTIAQTVNASLKDKT
jgi:fumarate reductase flavoprotein subunit